MERITFSLDDDLAQQFDSMIRHMGYVNRSEAVRDMLRERIAEHQAAQSLKHDCIATLSYVYNHHTLDLSERLTSALHAHHDLAQSTLHVHLDHEHCLEVTVLKGKAKHVKDFADAMMALKGVHYGKLHVIPVNSSSPYKRVGSRGHIHLTPMDDAD